MPKWTLNIEQDFALLLTATVRPNTRMSSIARSDPTLREADYVAGLTYYLTHHPRVRKFVFVENSGWPLDSIREAIRPAMSGQEVEFVSLDCNEHPSGQPFSIGYGESELMRRGLEASTLLKTAVCFGKITGRLRLLNMTRLLEAASRPFEMYCDLQSHHMPFHVVNTSRRWLAFEWAAHHHYQCDTRFFVCTPGFYNEHLRDLHERHTGTDAYWIEGAWFDTLMPLRHDPKLIVRFPVQPRYSGVNGTIGFSYDSPKENVKRTFRGTMRQVVPWWWI